MRRSLLTAFVALSVVAGGAGPALAADTAGVTAGAVAVSAAPGQAVNLKLTAQVRKALADAYWRNPSSTDPFPRAKVDGPKDVHYGKITGSTPARDVYWAIGDIGIKGDPVSYQGGPHIWRKVGNGTWKHVGDTGGCLSKVPAKLLKVWKQSSHC
ncbi:hypothetical protein FHS43_005267 [Streptosporangium becharense]|uniref:Uncharacterized protein n=1 Tax=Streptosporangium becharense TaxID=1816182 RepID=A0A7W9MI95_9ACTN|nr:hypothetical protein [Streptosporangium becharense]MBB2913958.1 hypothetical protein [Streptosporangium becharense]MBB5821381.1 hypothetical protein [Streptosporangium becharense]